MTNITINGVEVASESEILDLHAHIDALEAHPNVPNVDVQDVRDDIKAIKAELALDEAASLHDPRIIDLTAKIDALTAKMAQAPAPAAAQPPSGAQILAALIAALTGGAPIAPPAIVPGATTSNPAVVDVSYFPENAADAPSPSPEDSKIKVIGGKASSIPYLVDAQGAVFKFDHDAAGNLIPCVMGDPGNPNLIAPGGYQFSVNGTVGMYGAVQITVRQHQCWVMTPDGVTRGFSRQDNPNAGTTVVQLPPIAYDAGVPAGSSPSAPPALIDPPAPSVALGSSGKVIEFGAGTPYATVQTALNAAAAGDKVAYAAAAPRGVVFPESPSVPEGVWLDLGGRWSDLAALAKAFRAKDWAKVDSLYMPGAVIDCDGVALAHQLAGVVWMGTARVDGTRIKNCGQKEAYHGGTAAFRAYGTCIGTLSGSHNYITDCQNGVGPGGQTINTDFSETVILRVGLGDGSGGAHPVYDSGSVVRSKYGPNFFSNAMANPPGPNPSPNYSGGHALKSRAKVLTLVAPFDLQGNDAAALNRPDGSALQDQIGPGVIEQCSGAVQHSMISCTTESLNNGTAGMLIAAGATLIGNCESPNIMTGMPITVQAGVTFQGNKIVAQGSPFGAAPVTGLPA